MKKYMLKASVAGNTERFFYDTPVELKPRMAYFNRFSTLDVFKHDGKKYVYQKSIK